MLFALNPILVHSSQVHISLEILSIRHIHLLRVLKMPFEGVQY
jgi:hypothetical protein